MEVLEHLPVAAPPRYIMIPCRQHSIQPGQTRYFHEYPHRQKTLRTVSFGLFHSAFSKKTTYPMHGFLRPLAIFLLIAVCPLVTSGNADAQGWSVTEVQYQAGSARKDHVVSPTGPAGIRLRKPRLSVFRGSQRRTRRGRRTAKRQQPPHRFQLGIAVQHR